MDEKYYPPLFLTGRLPRPHPDEIIWLILCARRLGIKLWKDVYKIIHKMLQVVKLIRSEPYFEPLTLNPVSMGRVDFIIVKPQVSSKIHFNDISYNITGGCRYLICIGILQHLQTVINCAQMEIEYWSFCPTSRFSESYFAIHKSLNSNIDQESLMYLSGDTIMRDSTRITRLSRDQRDGSDFQEHIDTCLRYGLVTLSDPLNGVSCNYVDERGVSIL